MSLEPPATMRCLVTGASGFIGLHLTRALAAAGHHVTALGRHPTVGPWHAFLAADLQDTLPPATAFQGFDCVFHFAGKAHAIAESRAETASYFAIIRDGTERLLERCLQANVPRFVFASTVKAASNASDEARFFAQKPLQPLSEANDFPPDTPYGQAKRAAEALVLSAPFTHATVLRPCMVYGPGNKGNLTAMLEAIRRNRFPPLPETGNRRSLLHVDDLIQATLAAATLPAAHLQVFCISGPDAVSTRQLYDALRAVLNLPATATAIPLPLLNAAAILGDGLGRLLRRRMPLDSITLHKLTASAWYSHAKATQYLNFHPRVQLNAGLQSLLPIALS